MGARFALFLFPLALGFVAAAQESGRVAKSTLDGVYTVDQATRGKVTFDNNCSECHMSDLSGRSGPALKGDSFMEHWRGKSVGSLFEKIKTTMPADWRTQLSDPRTLDLVAFLLQENGFTAGDQELNTEVAGTLRIEDKTNR